MRKFRLAAPLMTAVLVLAACGNGDDGDGGDGDVPEGDGAIVVTSLWGGAEETAFQAVLDAFEEETGITAEYEANRVDYATVLRTRISGGNPPDVAIIPGIGTLRSLARDGSLIPMSELGIAQSDIEGNYAPGILDVGVVDDELYGIMVKLNSKATIFYSPERFGEMSVEPAETWDDLLALTESIKDAGATPWALGAGAESTWTLTDWFEIV
ncbi:MAG TPA: extracellular solute-binding protein, partial [Patescibacteria group bacterium]|nr:extracellular solute-binding protein [Patescibacteria group bacterium]